MNTIEDQLQLEDLPERYLNPYTICCLMCGAEDYEILRGDEVHPGYDGWPITSCCQSC